MTSQTYHVTLNFPQECYDHLETVKNNYVNLLKHKGYPYAVAEETCKSGQKHYHIAYDGPDTKNSTSNETRHYRQCHNQYLTKKEFPNAVKHTKHDDKKHLLGYLQKENLIEFTYPETEIVEAKRDYVSKKTVRNNIWTANNCINTFMEYIRSDVTHYHRLFTDNYNIVGTTKRMFKEFARNHPGKLQYSVYAKFNFEKLYEFLDVEIKLENYKKE